MEALEIFEALLTHEGRTDPYPVYAEMHRLGPVVEMAPGYFLVSGYAEVNEVLRNPGFGCLDFDLTAEHFPEISEQLSLAVLSRSILRSNPPNHKRMRSLMSAVFTPRRTSGLEPAITRTTGRLLDTMTELAGAGDEPVDFMAQFAFSLPVTVICELLGVPEADRAQFRDLTRDLTAALDLISDLDLLVPANEATAELTEYFKGLIKVRRADPRDDLVSALAQEADEAGGRLSEEELISNLILLLAAGFETTTNLFGNGLALLFQHPATMAALREGTLSYADFIEEVLRFDPPVQMTSRVPLADGLQVAGRPVPNAPGAEVMLLLAAANRDLRRFTAPELFNPLRPDNVPLSFGAGGHYCLGAALARLEANTAFPLLFERFPGLAPAGEPVRNAGFNLRGYRSFPVYLSGGPA